MNKKTVTCEEVRLKILDSIDKNRIKAGGRLPSFRALAMEFGASIPTIQRAMAMLTSEGLLTSRVGSGTYVTGQLRLNNRLIGILMPYAAPRSGNFMSDAFSSMRKVILDHGYFPVSVEPTPNTSGEVRNKEEMALVNKLVSQGMAGIIVDSCANEDSPIWRQLRQLNVAVLCFNNSGRAAGYLDCVSADNYQGGVLVAERLLSADRKKVAIISDPFSGTSSVGDRIRGFCETMKEAGVVVSADKIISLRSLVLDEKEAVAELSNKLKDVDGVFGINDGTAIRTMNILIQAGRRVPEDVAIVGFDDSELCEHVSPRLDSIRQPSAHMGQRAAEMLLDRIENPDNKSDTIHVKAQVSLTVRNSVR
ncbi:MAG: GntR family transcriptional regulator [Victivallales bacterium]